METPSESASSPPGGQLNDLQSYLNTFNKEIESSGDPGFSVVANNSNGDPGFSVEVNNSNDGCVTMSPSDVDKQNIFLLDDGNVEASVLKTQKGKTLKTEGAAREKQEG